MTDDNSLGPVPSPDLKDYYGRRAPQYDQIYQRPERQQALRELEQRVETILAGRRILEVACGSGYWTRLLAPAARGVLATDINEAMLGIARERCRAWPRVEFQVMDCYALDATLGSFDGAFLGFWWSHIAKRDIPRFLQVLHDRLEDQALVVVLDNRYVEGNSTPISRIDTDGNSYQLRSLADGSRFEILKNFPTSGEMRAALGRRAGAFSHEKLGYYWLAQYRYRK